MRIEGQGTCDASGQGAVQHEVQRADRRTLVADDLASRDLGKVRLDALRRHMLDEERVVLLIERDHGDVRDVALVSASRMGDLPQFHAISSYRTAHCTSSRATNVVPMARTSRTDLTAPPPPDGPFVYKASTSSPMRSGVSRRGGATRHSRAHFIGLDGRGCAGARMQRIDATIASLTLPPSCSSRAVLSGSSAWPARADWPLIVNPSSKPTITKTCAMVHRAFAGAMNEESLSFRVGSNSTAF